MKRKAVINWKKLYKAAKQAEHCRAYWGHVLHVVPSKRKHDSGYAMFTTYLVRWTAKKNKRVPEVTRLYTTNDVVTFNGTEPWIQPAAPVHMDIRLDGVIQLWCNGKVGAAKLRVTVMGLSTCEVRVLGDE